MSISIENGFKAELELSVLHLGLTELSTKIREKAVGMFNDYLAREMTYFYDLWSVRLGPDTMNPYNYVCGDVDERMTNVLTGARDPSVDYSFSVTLFPVSGAYLIAVFTAHEEFLSMFSSDLEVLDFSYWPTEDVPDAFTEEEWDRRKMQWQMVFRGSNIPAHVGYTRDLVRTVDLSPRQPVELLSESIPPFDERVKRIALDMYIDEQQITDFRTLNRLLTDSRASSAITTCENVVKSLLRPEITGEMLNKEHTR
jgi:hypothetical protein